MINILKEEPIFKRILLYITLSMLVGMLVLNIIHIKQLESMYKIQNNLTNSIVGSLLEKYPKEEHVILDAINNLDNEDSLRGEALLSKYGYEDGGIFKDDDFKKIINKSLILFFALSIVIIGLNVMTFNKVFNILLDLILQILKYVDNFVEGNYKVDTLDEREGMFMTVGSKLNDLGKKLEVEINKLNLEKENLKSLVTDISHQLKTPLAALKLHNSILIEGDLSLEDRQKFLYINERSIIKLHNLIDALVNISRLESGMIEINPEENSIKQTLIKAINTSYVKAIDKDISINLSGFKDMKILHDIRWTEEAISNVLENAIKYTPNGGNIIANKNIDKGSTFSLLLQKC